MPRNGSGQYNPLTNTWNPPVTGVLATGSDFQAQLNDISAALTQSVSKDGQTPMTASLPMGNNSIVGIAAGTATAPSISANGDTNTGLYFPAADTVGVAVGGVQKAVFSTSSTTIDGLMVGRGGGSISSNVAIGANALQSNTTGSGNTANGIDALLYNTTGTQNTANGANALYSNTTGYNNTASGVSALQVNTTGSSNTASGAAALAYNLSGNSNTACGAYALGSGQTYTAGNFSIGTTYVIQSVGTTNFTAIGASSNTVGVMFVATGVGSGTGTARSRMTGNSNTANGVNALPYNTTGSDNTANGVNALAYNTTGFSNTANGAAALLSNTTGTQNTASGLQALQNNTTGYNNTAIGAIALSSNVAYANCGGFGFDAQVTGSNQIQIGNSATTTYVYGTVQNRSDARDKTDIRDTHLGLDFIKALRPVDYRWDYREDYRPAAPKFDLQKPDESASEEEKLAYQTAEQAHKAEMDAWLEAVKPANIVRDGSKKRIRYHHGLIAQEVKAVLDAKGVDFGGFQDHSVKGGEDVLSIGYIELIAPMIKAMQEQQAIIEALKVRITALEAKS